MLNTHAAGARRHRSLTAMLSAFASAGWDMLYHYRVRRTVAELRRLDDRILRDMGLTRGELYSAVSRGRTPDDHRG